MDGFWPNKDMPIYRQDHNIVPVYRLPASTDGTMTAKSQTLIPTQSAVVTYANNRALVMQILRAL